MPGAGRLENMARRAGATLVDMVHLGASGFLCLGWLWPSLWLEHLVMCFATLSGWAAYGECAMSVTSAELRGHGPPRFEMLRTPRILLLSLLSPILGTVGKPLDGECDLAGAAVISASACASMWRAGVPAWRLMAGLLLAGFTSMRAMGR